MSDRRGLPLAVVVTPGQRNESAQFEPALDAAGRPSGQARRRPGRMIADRGYDVDRIRGWLRRCGIGAVIPPKRTRARRFRYDRTAYHERNVVERAIGHLKKHRRLATRQEKLARSFVAMVKLALAVRYLRLIESRDKP